MIPAVEAPTLFESHPNFSDEVNRNIIQSEVEGGVLLRDLPPGAVLEVQTQNHVYRIVTEREGTAWISGHPVFCPDPVLVDIHGSTWGGSMIKEHYIGRGMHLEFCHPEYRTPIVTSRIQEVRERVHLDYEKSSAIDNPLGSAKLAPTDSVPAPRMLVRGTFTKPS